MGLFNKMTPARLDISPHVGIEIEFDSIQSRTFIKEKLRAALKSSGLNDACARIDYEIIASEERDSGKFGFEATLLSPETNFIDKLKKLMDVLQKHDTYIDDRCGFHIHIDCRYRDPYEVYMTLVEHQDFLFACASPERIKSPYCKPNDPMLEPKMNNAIIPSSKYQTVEVRVFEAGFDVDKLIFYVKTVLGIVNFNTKYDEPKLINILGTKT